MTINAATFQDIAETILVDTFSAFAVSTVINKKAFTFSSQTYSVTSTVTLPMIKVRFKQSQIDGDSIRITDYKLIGQRQLVTFMPSVSDCEVVHGGEYGNIIGMEIDPAEAIIKLHVRPL